MRVYYDTSALLVAVAKRPSPLLDPRRVTWTVIYSFEISAAEATIREFLDELYVQFARQGVEVVLVTMADITSYQRGHRALKKKFQRLKMSSRDIKHLFAAAAAAAELFISKDADFWDPKNKVKSRPVEPGWAVAELIESELAIEVLRPEEAEARLLGP